MQVIYERCAAVDVGKDVIAVAVRKPGDGPGGRVTVRRMYKTFYGVLREAARWLMSEGVTHVAMEATGVIFGSNKFSSSFHRSGLSRTRL
jgi:transposase